jgi:signal transduction histidine kinase
MLLVEVDDQGIGLTEEQMARLFAPFQQAQRMTIGGTGLGLFSLAKRLQALQGHYGVTGRKDGTQGSLFWFAVPFKIDDSTLEADQIVQIASSQAGKVLRLHLL